MNGSIKVKCNVLYNLPSVSLKKCTIKRFLTMIFFYKENLFDCTFIDNEKFFDHHIVLTKIQSVINKKMDTK